ncbi:dsRBD fold-containing protein [Kitasatospora sp. NPDC049285]|uniref:dsRBD fold-containing protein n=1 Tax=Kitasatospora sp. NPDC049285 TaxID=3157096 RepID=UPI00342C007C
MHKQWDVRLSFDEDGTHTSCQASLIGQGAPGLAGHGQAERSTQDRPVSRIGEELAAARALGALAEQLRDQAAGEVDRESHRVGYLMY